MKSKSKKAKDSQNEKNEAVLQAIQRMKDAKYSVLSPRDYFADEVVLYHIIEPYNVPKTLYYLDRSKVINRTRKVNGFQAERVEVPKTTEQFVRSVARHRSMQGPSIYLTLFEEFEELKDWAKCHVNAAQRNCLIWSIDGEELNDYKYTVLKPRVKTDIAGPKSEFLILHVIPQTALVGRQLVCPDIDDDTELEENSDDGGINIY